MKVQTQNAMVLVMVMLGLVGTVASGAANAHEDKETVAFHPVPTAPEMSQEVPVVNPSSPVESEVAHGEAVDSHRDAKVAGAAADDGCSGLDNARVAHHAAVEGESSGVVSVDVLVPLPVGEPFGVGGADLSADVEVEPGDGGVWKHESVEAQGDLKD